MDVCVKEAKIMSTEKRSDNLHKASSILSIAAILLSIALFVRMETVVHDTKMMDSKFSLQIQQIKDAQDKREATFHARVKENFDIVSESERKSKIARRSLKTNRNDSIGLKETGYGSFKELVTSIVLESVETYCLAPRKICVVGPPGPKGNQGNRGKRGPQGTKGRKGTKGIMGTPGEPGKQGMKGDVGTSGIKGEKGDPGTPGHPGPKGEQGESISGPEVIVSPDSLTVTQNQTATFYCSADGNPKPSVSWSKISGTGPVNTDGQDNKLQIRSADYNDSGSYVCTATNILGQVKKVVKLFVEVPPQFIKTPDRIIKVKANSVASVFCQAFGFPSPTIVWSRGLVPLPQGRTTVNNGTLNISNFSPQDAGTYQCKASNKLGSVSVLTTLNYVQPDFWKSSVIGGNAFYESHLSQFLTPAVGSHPQWVLCYRASTHGWAVSTFHSRCDGKRNTVTIIKKGQYVFGGYTDISWESSGGYTSTSNAFIFSLNNKEAVSPFKSMVTNPSRAIERSSSHGVTFGGGHDICINNNANSNTKSYTEFGHDYSVPSGVKDRKTILAGTRNFTPDEVEVFYLG